MAKAKEKQADEAQASAQKNYITETEVLAALEAAQADSAKKDSALALYDRYAGPFKLTKTPIPRGVLELSRALREQ